MRTRLPRGCASSVGKVNTTVEVLVNVIVAARIMLTEPKGGATEYVGIAKMGSTIRAMYEVSANHLDHRLTRQILKIEGSPIKGLVKRKNTPSIKKYLLFD